eukprot:CAMPEP_0170179182 /NCGR_PEP_ID=MMETSP0040_2-20121228/16551_1 /TAXON_ID=641309 /ORGANISM="Lotharella oceanica, Strain CCMP622" /LENGTH=140 /DNA_ID=CAMNT_0010423075 /DNA_START=67 /DNA_END=485 /DNA_ORIENTATION=+
MNPSTMLKPNIATDIWLIAGGSVQSSSSMSYVRVALAGINGGFPCLPYAYSGDVQSTDLSPCCIVIIPISHPSITRPDPTTTSRGRFPRLFSMTSPESSLPTTWILASFPFDNLGPLPSMSTSFVNLPDPSDRSCFFASP